MAVVFMAKPWKCRLGWHSYVRQSSERSPNRQICRRCGKKRDLDTIMRFMGGSSAGGGCSGFPM